MQICTHTHVNSVYVYVHISTHSCIHLNIYTTTCEVGVHTCKYIHTHVQIRMHTRCLFIYICTHVYTYNHTHNKDTYACIPIRTHCICMHPWCLSCVHVCMYTPTHTYKTLLYTHTHVYLACIYVNTHTNTYVNRVHICKSIHPQMQTRCAYMQIYTHAQGLLV